MIRSRPLRSAVWLLACLALVLVLPGAAMAKKKNRPTPVAQHCAGGGIKIDKPGPRTFECFENEVVAAICVKAGTEIFATGEGFGETSEGCYEFSGIGEHTGSVSGGGTGRDCKDISYSVFYCEPGEEPPPPVCGDGIVEGEEQCDPPGRINENLVCNEGCQLVEVPEPGPEPVCGNGIVEAGETCDPPGIIDELLGCTESCQLVELDGENDGENGGENGEER